MTAFTRLSGLGAAVLALAASVHAASGHGTASHPELSKRQNANLVTGAPDGQIHPRIEIRQLEQNADQWNLFMLAMQAFQNTDHSDVMSWYQIAGIHGMPYVVWNGVQGSQPGNGYCPHTSPLFPCWHRPYVALWEQQMLVAAQNIVNQFQGADKTRYQNALSTLRHPYWDWAEVPPSGNSVDAMPQSMTNQTVTVNTPQGQQQIPNPLYAFTKMNPHASSDFTGVGGGDWDQWGSTLRYPSDQSAGATSNDAQAVQSIGNYNSQARAQVYRVLTACSNFLDIANDGVAEQSQSCGVSLESIHNGIHTLTGGQGSAGHMAFNNFAAFDPAFFLHHANVDRLFAMWQNLNPNSYISPSSQGNSATFTIAANSQVDGNTALEPFHGPNGPWTCNSVRDITTFHYTYPELQQGNLAQAVNSLYGSNAVPQRLSSSSAAPSSTSTGNSASGSGSGSGSRSATNTAAGASGTSSGSNRGGSTTDGANGGSSRPGQTSSGRNGGGSSNSNSPFGSNNGGSGSSTPFSGSSTPFGGFSTNSGRNSGSSIFNSRSTTGTSDTASAAGASGSNAASSGSGITSASGSTASGGASGNGAGGAGAGAGGVQGGNGGSGGAAVGGAGSIIGGQQVSVGATSAPSPGLFSTSFGGSPATSGVAGATGSASFPASTGGASFPQLGGGSGSGSNGTSNSSSNANLPSLLTPTGRTHDYTCHIISEKHGLGGSYTVFGFLGNSTAIPDSPQEWFDHPDFCGSHSVFAPLGKQGAGMLVGGTICLTTALVGKVATGDLPSIEESDVLPYLQNNLQWKVATAGGTAVPNDQVPGLTVGAVSQKVMPAANQASLPTYGNGNVNNDVTHGKAGGIQSGMQYNWWDVCGAAPQPSQSASSY